MTIAWRSFSVLGCIAAALAFTPARAMPLSYRVAPNSTDINFAVGVMGVTTCHGAFSQFSGDLSIDLEQPELSKVAVRIDSGSAAMQWGPATKIVRGESYLDSEHYPEMEFVSERAEMLSDGKVRMDGTLTLRGVSHPESFVADLSERHWNNEREAEEADFTAIGTINRKDYQVGSDQAMLDNRVTFIIHTRVLLTAPGFSSAQAQ
jgi:polyisoprenoid-binding protein YceI